MHWWFQEGLVGWLWFFLVFVLLILIGLGIMVVLRRGLRERRH
jgi:ABC-type multidrug transport system permease subunit